jgi:VacB/RNase II family 3'-5' exoribonuclease
MDNKETKTIDLDVIAKQAMRDRDLLPDYSKEVLNEVSQLQNPSIPFLSMQARDLRNLLWFSVDNDESKDLDQLTYAENVNEGRHRILIAVANVSYLVKQNTAIDTHALHNTTSVYTPTEIFPMLPSKLSTDLTSLNPDQDRLALVFEGVISKDGALEEYSIYLAYVHNYAKLAYNNLSAWLDGTVSPPAPIENIPGLAEQIRLQDSIAYKLHIFREAQGTLNLETIEPRAILSDGIVVDIKPVAITRTRKLIENFMIVANTISGKYSAKHAIPHLRRVVIIPKRWDKIVAIAEERGYNLPQEPNALALEKFLMKQKEANPSTYPDLSLTIIKLLGKGEYRVAFPGKPPPGHFGLALRDYTHSTAPNRRYPDLITQRILIANLTGQPLPYGNEELISLADHCTQKEDDAEKVERRMRKSAAALVLSPMIGKQFEAIVTGASEKGTWVRLLNPPAEGKLVKGNANVDVGDHIKVKLIYTDVWNGYIDFAKN